VLIKARRKFKWPKKIARTRDVSAKLNQARLFHKVGKTTAVLIVLRQPNPVLASVVAVTPVAGEKTAAPMFK
jgi:hypothetical protein